MELVEFMSADGRRKIAVNPYAVARLEEVNATTTNIVQLASGASSQNGFVSVAGSFDVVRDKLNAGI